MERMISIHAPRVGSDASTEPPGSGRYDFNPRSPCGERLALGTFKIFIKCNFNPRSPCGERPSKSESAMQQTIFQSTLPVWGATWLYASKRYTEDNFNPRSPCGERLKYFKSNLSSLEFQSTLPVWGATINTGRVVLGTKISIHAPRVGSDSAVISPSDAISHFNPRSPCGERQTTILHYAKPEKFQSTLPVWGATRTSRCSARLWSYFNPRSPCGERRKAFDHPPHHHAFQSTLPVWGATALRKSSPSK